MKLRVNLTCSESLKEVMIIVSIGDFLDYVPFACLGGLVITEPLFYAKIVVYLFANTTSMPTLNIQGLNLSHITEYQGVLDCIIEPGQTLGLSGPSGVGKSVLIKAIADIIPHQGKIFLDNVESQMMSAYEWRKKVTVFPAESQWWFDTVGEHFKAYRPDLFEPLGFDSGVLSWEVSHLSSGEKQRLACIRGLQNQPQVLLMDEPTANLDSDNKRRLETLIAQYQTQYQTPVIWVSHDHAQLQSYCHQILVMDKNGYQLQTNEKANR